MTKAGIDLRTPRTVHIIGIGGSGMSAIASVLTTMGHRVSGSDLNDSPTVARLRAEGVDVVVGHDPANVVGAELVARSTAIPDHNVEVVAAGGAVASRADVLAAISATRRTIAVAGTHGKTTTSSMLALVLREAGLDPCFIIGGDISGLGSGAVWSDGAWFVVEADESDGTFLTLGAEAAIVTSVEPDHIEHWGGFDELVDGFDRFFQAAPGPLLVCADDGGARQLGERHGARSYGLDEHADYRMSDFGNERAASHFRLTTPNGDSSAVSLAAPGLYNARNAAGALAIAVELGVDLDTAVRGLAHYAGVGRRFEFRGEAGGVTFVDDYAHLPTEVGSVLEAARAGGWERIVTVFQPHRYSRTAELAETFADVFTASDLTVITDVYASGEQPRPGVSGKLVLDAVLDAHPWRRVAYAPRREDQLAYLGQTLRAGDLCLTLGAGDLTTLPDELRVVLEPA